MYAYSSYLKDSLYILNILFFVVVVVVSIVDFVVADHVNICRDDRTASKYLFWVSKEY